MQLLTKRVLLCALFLWLAVTMTVQAGGFNAKIGALVWSPDGQSLAYTTKDGLYVADMDGQQRRIADVDPMNWTLTWSPDGQSILSVLEVDNKANIYRTPVSGGEAEALTQDDGWRPDYYAPGGIEPAYSPDGESIAFLSLREGDDFLSLYLMDADGGGQRRLTAIGDVTRPVWSPDGEQIAFIVFSENNDGLGDLYTIDRDGQNLKRLTDTADVDGYEAPSWWPDGKHLAFTAAQNQKRVESISRDGTNRRLIASNARTALIAPDGRHLLYTSLWGKWGELRIFDKADGSAAAITLPGERAYYHASWSPDGTQIAFVARRFDTPKSEDIIVTDADGGNPRVLVSLKLE